MRKIVFIFVAAVFLITMGSTRGTADYYKRPPNAVMNYVPQNIGIYDTYYGDFKETDCRACHGDSNTVSNRHHYSALAFADCPDGCPSQNCLTACHDPVINPVTNPTGDCKICHIDGTWVPVDIGSGVGNLGYPHHRSDLASSGQCTACHQPNLLVEPKSVKPPLYYPVAYTLTPKLFNCENCHWPSGAAPHLPPSLSDWNSWTGLPKPTTWPDLLPHPAPIEANGPATTGNVTAGDPDPNANKPYRPLDGTHHEIDGYILPNCSLCHGDNLSFNTDNPLLIRYCENCHSRDSLHGIQEHVTADNGLTVQEKCIACHGGMPDTTPTSGAKSPVIIDISPRYGPQGTSCTITGKNFDTSSSIRNILLTPKMGATDQTYIIPSGLCSWWSNDLIIFSVPSGLDARNYSVKVQTVNGTSNIRVFTLTGTQPCISCPTLAPNIDSMEPLLGADNSLITINGQNFGDRHTGDRDVLLVQGVSPSIAAPILSWTNKKIQFQLPPYAFAPGTIQVKVQTENGESNQKDFELRRGISFFSMTHPGTVVLSLSGLGFGDIRQYVRPDGYGWVSTISLNHPDGTISISPDSITSWSDTEIQLTLPTIQFDFYGVTVDTTYFFDVDGDGVYTLGLDTIYQTVTSDPLLFRPIECNLVPDATTIPRGGTLGFQGTVTNYTNKSATVLFASKVTLPSGNMYPSSGYLVGPLSVSFGPYQSKSGHLSLAIPSYAPTGTYTYHGYLGNYGVGLYSQCQFNFTITQ
jgi:hypothetical protein